MPEQKARLPFHIEFTPDEFARLSRGLLAYEMEDKWFIFFENGWLYLHRSWTGVCVYQVRIEQQGNIYTAVETWLNQDPEQYKAIPSRFHYEVALLSWLIGTLVLGKFSPFPVPDTLPPAAPPGAYQHHVAGTGYPEVVITDENTG